MNTRELIRTFLKFLPKDQYKLFIISILLGIMLFAVELVFIYALQGFMYAIGLLELKNSNLPSWYPKELSMCLVLFFVFGVIRGVVIGLKGFYAGIIKQRFLKKLRLKILNFALYHPEKTSSHDMISKFTDTLDRGGNVVIYFSGLVTALLAAGLLFISGIKFAPYEMCISFSILFLLMLASKFINKYISEFGYDLSHQWSKVTKVLIEGIKHYYFFHAHGLIYKQEESGQKAIRKYERSYRNFFLFSSIRSVLPQLIGIMVISMIAFVSIRYLHTPKAMLIAFFYLFLRLSQTGSEIYSNINLVGLNMPSFRELGEWTTYIDSLDRKELGHQNDSAIQRDITVELENVKFSYGEKTIIDNINFKVSKGEMVVIQGESGSGKSTLLSLILGINKPDSGKVLFNDLSVKDEFSEIRSSLSYVGPDPFMFEGSIRENLLFGNPDREQITDDALHNSLKDVLLDDFISSQKEGLDHTFNEHADASTGQKQRLALARMILRKPRLIILDEATANLDKQTEKSIMTNLSELLSSATTIMVTHKENLKDAGNQFIHLEKL